MPRTKEQFQKIREKTKETILNSALRLFATKGYHGTSISDIAYAAGISKGLAYNYFESKQEIIHSIFKKLLEIGEHFEKQTDSIDDPYENIKHLINISFKYYQENEEFLSLYLLFVFQPGILEEGKKVVGNYRLRYVKKIEKTFKKAGFNNPKLEVRIFDALLDGIGMNYIAFKEDFPIKKIKNHLLRIYSKEGIKKVNR